MGVVMFGNTQADVVEVLEYLSWTLHRIDTLILLLKLKR